MTTLQAVRIGFVWVLVQNYCWQLVVRLLSFGTVGENCCRPQPAARALIGTLELPRS
jgi:hypothetical protein